MNSLYGKWKQWRANRDATTEFRGYVEAELVQHDLARLNTKLTGRIDALETYVEDVVEKYMKRMNTREARAKLRDEGPTVVPMTGFETIRQKYGGRE